MRTVAVINQKGGCGKTTTAINLGACLAYLKKRVLVVDLDPQAHATLGFGINPGERRTSIYDLIAPGYAGSPRIGEVIVGLGDHLDLIPSDVMLSTAEPLLLQKEGREYCLCGALEPLHDRYDFIIIDCPPNIGVLTFNALHACTEAIIPMESGLFALHGLAKLLETIHVVDQKRAVPIEAYALATMYDRRTRIAYESLDELRRHMRGHVFKTVINLNVKLKEAAGYGQTILEYDRNSTGFKDYLALARETLSIRKLRKVRAREQDRYLKPVITKDGVLFTYYSPKASRVYVAADFNDWKVDQLPMENVEGTGMWQRLVPLKKGRYEYKFYVDGQWVNDPENPSTVANEFGENSTIEIP
ncbi:MAG TPA: AAA family ATPase [Deltaproteobacteria bacterium]|nr:AAA family ATPase [Deltaproteobacteria bacterium]